MATEHTNFKEALERRGRYRLEKCLGRGSWGEVYVAQDVRLNRTVALKVPRLQSDDGTEVLSRFGREVLAGAAIEHPNICAVYDSDEVECRLNRTGQLVRIPFVIMAYVKGKPMSEHVGKGVQFPYPVALRLAETLARAMHAAHQRGIIHRDLKPANILINQNREPIIMDFGLARWVESAAARMTAANVPLGTPAYMSPEQAVGQVEAHGYASDIYALGVILYEMLTGQLPIARKQGEGIHAYLFRVCTEAPVPPTTYRRDLDSQLQALCLKALAKKPQERYASMEEFAKHLAWFSQRLQQQAAGRRSDPEVPVATPRAPRAPTSDPEIRSTPRTYGETERSAPPPPAAPPARGPVQVPLPPAAAPKPALEAPARRPVPAAPPPAPAPRPVAEMQPAWRAHQPVPPPPPPAPKPAVEVQPAWRPPPPAPPPAPPQPAVAVQPAWRAPQPAQQPGPPQSSQLWWWLVGLFIVAALVALLYLLKPLFEKREASAERDGGTVCLIAPNPSMAPLPVRQAARLSDEGEAGGR
jgi:serine/threonine protein kinase